MPLEERHRARASQLASEARPGFVYRGMTRSELHDHWAKGGIKSAGRYSAPSEGTCFANDPEDAESYVDFGRDDPRVTGAPNYLVEVREAGDFQRGRDGYPKTQGRIPLTRIARLWKLRAIDESVIVADEYRAVAP